MLHPCYKDYLLILLREMVSVQRVVSEEYDAMQSVDITHIRGTCYLFSYPECGGRMSQKMSVIFYKAVWP
jgi:hypothetical protein